MAVAVGAVGLAAPGMAQQALKAKRAEKVRDPSLRLGEYLAGRAAQLDNDWKSAGALMRQVWESDRGDEIIRRNALLLSLAGGEFAAAVNIAHAVPPDAGDAGLANLILAVDHIAEGRIPAAAESLSRVPAEGANRYIKPLLTGWIEVARQHNAAAVAALAPLDQLRGSGELRTIQTALIDEATGDNNEAAAMYSRVVEGQPSTRALVLAAEFYQRRGQIDRAKTLIQRIDPDRPSGAQRAAILAKLNANTRLAPAPDARNGAAAALFEISVSLSQQDGKEAILDAELYTQLALRLRPNFPDAQILMGAIFEHFGRIDDAVAALQAVDPSAVMRSTAVHQAMNDLIRAGQVDQAFKLGRTAFDAHPENIGLGLDYADALRRKARYLEAIGVYDKLALRVPATSAYRAGVLFGRGIAFEEAHDWPKAEADLQAALMLRPEDPELLNYLAFSWADHGVNLDRARTMLERAIQLSPNNGAFIDSMGWVMFRQGDYEEAVKQLERAVALDSNDATVADHLGDAYWRVGRKIEARTQWERASRLTSDKGLAEQIRTKLRDGLSPDSKHASAQ